MRLFLCPNKWSTLNENVLNILLKDAVRVSCTMRWSHTEYIILYPNEYGFSISKTREGVDTWEIVMLQGAEIGECEFYYNSEITDFDVVRGLTDEQIIPLAQAIKEWKY